MVLWFQNLRHHVRSFRLFVSIINLDTSRTLDLTHQFLVSLVIEATEMVFRRSRIHKDIFCNFVWTVLSYELGTTRITFVSSRAECSHAPREAKRPFKRKRGLCAARGTRLDVIFTTACDIRPYTLNGNCLEAIATVLASICKHAFTSICPVST